MKNPFEWAAKKAHRVSELLELTTRYAADADSRRALLHVYSNLSRRELYDEPVSFRLRLNERVFPFHMRLSDIFIIGEILHEKQYRLQSALPAQPTIVDCGANIGISALWFLALNPGARIHAFEPAGDNLAFLRRNIEGLDMVTLRPEAVGARSGDAILHHGAFGGMHSLCADGEGESVRVVALADYMAERAIERIDLLKLDIEGGELDALKGLGARIGDVSVIIGEVHEAIIDQDEFYAFLAENGFSVLWKREFAESREQKVHGFEAARI